jgi:hypothetical protein
MDGSRRLRSNQGTGARPDIERAACALTGDLPTLGHGGGALIGDLPRHGGVVRHEDDDVGGGWETKSSVDRE